MDKYTLVGCDGNGFAVIAYTKKAMKAEKLGSLTDKMIKEAVSGDYSDLIFVCSKYLDMANEAARKK